VSGFILSAYLRTAWVWAGIRSTWRAVTLSIWDRIAPLGYQDATGWHAGREPSLPINGARTGEGQGEAERFRCVDAAGGGADIFHDREPY
jgi:hypothetical protein